MITVEILKQRDGYLKRGDIIYIKSGGGWEITKRIVNHGLSTTGHFLLQRRFSLQKEKRLNEVLFKYFIQSEKRIRLGIAFKTPVFL